MSGWLDVVWCPNPMLPVSDRQIRRIVLSGKDTVDSVIRRLGLQATLLDVSLNGSRIVKRRWNKKSVHQGDHLVLMQRAAGEGAAAAAAAEGGKSAAEVAFVALAENVAISIAISYIAQALLGSDSGTSNSGAKGPDGYSIEGGANQMRQYEPLVVVLGEHRLFPDYGSRPFTEFINDPTATIDVINGTIQYEDQTPPPFDFEPPPASLYTPIAPWTQLSGSPPDSFGYYGDNATRSYNGGSGIVMLPHTFVVRSNGTGPENYTTWEEYMSPADPDAGPSWVASGTLPVVIRYGYINLVNTERLTSIFNFGFGDLTISDLRIASTVIDDYKNVQRDDATVPTDQLDRTLLDGYTCPDWIGTSYPTHVQTVEGGQLQQHTDIPDDGWILRQGLPGCTYIQFDLAGRLFSQAGGEIGNLSCTFEAQFREVGAAVWTDFSFSPMTLTNGITTPMRETFREYMPAPGRYEVRVRRQTVDETLASNISDFNFTQVKFFIADDSLYPAQNRMGLQIQATGQLNGRLDRLSALVQAKHWVWTSAQPWDGSYPGSGEKWSWTNSTNPAALFLYYARGGFLNASAAPAYMGGGRGWLDRPDVGNGARLFGAGLPDSRIDYAALVAWAQFCDANNLQCRMVLDTQRPCAEVLDDIAIAGRASKTWAPGKLSVVWEAPGQPTVAVFGMANIVAGTFQITYDDTTLIDEFVLDFSDSDNDYTAGTVRAVVPGISQPTNTSNVKAAFSMSKAQAQRHVNLLAAARFYRRRHIQWEATREALLVQRGDVVALSHDLTQWAFSGRLVGLTVTAGEISAIELSSNVDNAAGAPAFYMWVRRPDGTFLALQCIPPVTSSRTLEVMTAWQVSDAPGQLGQGIDNPDSGWADTVPEDWIFIAGPTATPGKRVRITSIEPSSKGQFRLVATDEVAEYYPLEYGVDNAVDVASGERLVARAFNLGLSADDVSGLKLVWDLENAHGANVMISVDGGAATQIPVQGYLTVAGEELLLPDYDVGTTLDIQVLPVAAGTPVAITGDQISVTI